MFIRQTQTRSRTSAKPYATFRLVQSRRVGTAVKQITLLNLGSHFDLPKQEWPAMAQYIDDLLHGQQRVADTTLSQAGLALAQRYAAQLIALRASAADTGTAQAGTGESGVVERYQEVDLDSLDLVRPRSIGVEHAALSAMRQCGFEDKLAALGLNRPQVAAAVGNIVARLAHPGSELATHAWLRQRSGLGELIGFDFESMDLNRLYRASDALFKHREALHLLISVPAYHFVHTLRLKLKASGIDDSWQTLRETLAVQQRVTATLLRRDGRAVHVRKATRAEPQHQKINEILGLTPNPGGTHRVLV